MATLIPVTGCTSSDPSHKVQIRYDINDMQAHHKEQFDLFIRAIANLQAKPETDSMSWYGIASESRLLRRNCHLVTTERYPWCAIYSMAF